MIDDLSKRNIASNHNSGFNTFAHVTPACLFVFLYPGGCEFNLCASTKKP